MNDMLVKVLFTLLGLYSGLLTWLLRTAWADMKAQAKELEKMKLGCAEHREALRTATAAETDRLVAKIARMIDDKMENWWNRVELDLIKRGRLPTGTEVKDD